MNASNVPLGSRNISHARCRRDYNSQTSVVSFDIWAAIDFSSSTANHVSLVYDSSAVGRTGVILPSSLGLASLIDPREPRLIGGTF